MCFDRKKDKKKDCFFSQLAPLRKLLETWNKNTAIQLYSCFFCQLNMVKAKYVNSFVVSFTVLPYQLVHDFVFRGRKMPDLYQPSDYCVHFCCMGKLLLMEEILRQLIGSLSNCFQGFIHPRWCRISSINSINPKRKKH